MYKKREREGGGGKNKDIKSKKRGRLIDKDRWIDRLREYGERGRKRELKKHVKIGRIF